MRDRRDVLVAAWILTGCAVAFASVIAAALVSDGMPEPGEWFGAVISCVWTGIVIALAIAVWVGYWRRWRR